MRCGWQSVRESGGRSDVHSTRVDEQHELIEVSVDMEAVRPVEFRVVSTQF